MGTAACRRRLSLHGQVLSMRDLVSVMNNRYYTDTSTYDVRRQSLVIVTTIGKWQGRTQ